VLYLIFLLSGAGALVFERLWFHQAGLALGSSVWATSLVLAGFMAGLALGNALAARLGPVLARPLRFYALLELAVGATGLTLVWVLPTLSSSIAALLGPFLDWPLAHDGLRLSLAFALLLVPSTAMGATLPVVVAALCRRDPRYGRALGRLYGFNTLGAVAGVLVAEAVLLPALGVRSAAVVAAFLNLVAAASALVLSRRLDSGASDPGASASVVPPRRALPLLAAASICGAVLLGLEVVWFRFLLLFVDGTGLAFAVLLALVLSGIGLGGLLGSAWLSRDPEADRDLPAICLAAGATCCLTYAGFDLVARPVMAGSWEGWARTLALATPLIFPSSLLSGVLFPLVGVRLHRAMPGAARSTGLLTLANTVGAAMGSLAAGFALLPRLGIERSIRGLASAYGLAAVLSVAGTRGTSTLRGKVGLVLAGGLFVAALGWFPSGLMRERFLWYPVEPFRRAEGAVPVEIREGVTETAILLRVDRWGKPFYHRLLTNNFSMSATHFRSQRYMRLFVYLPVAVHPGPRSALLLCYGVGVTAKTLTETKELATIDVVDTSRDILDLSRIVFPEPKDQPLRDPRVRVHVEDARHFLQTTARRFDIITGEPPPPGMAGVANLYTVEFFRLLSERLDEGGIATYWLPVADLHERETKAIVRGFCEAFPDCSLWSGSVLNWILVGTRNARGPVPLERFRRQWEDPEVLRTLRALAFETPEQLGALFIADATDLREWTRDTPMLDDDHPKRLGDGRADPSTVARVYRRYSDVDVTLPRFLRSDLVRRLWPAELRDATASSFELQRVVNAVSYESEIGPSEALPMLHRILTASDLRVLPMLLLGNTADPGGRAGAPNDPSADFLLGVRALCERDYTRAAAHFERSEMLGDSGRRTAYSRLYALAMAGRAREAAEIAGSSGIAAGRTPEDARALRFFAETLGVELRSPGGTP